MIPGPHRDPGAPLDPGLPHNPLATPSQPWGPLATLGLTVFRFSKKLKINERDVDSEVKFGEESEKNSKKLYDQEIWILPGPKYG